MDCTVIANGFLLVTFQFPSKKGKNKFSWDFQSWFNGTIIAVCAFVCSYEMCHIFERKSRIYLENLCISLFYWFEWSLCLGFTFIILIIIIIRCHNFFHFEFVVWPIKLFQKRKLRIFHNNFNNYKLTAAAILRSNYFRCLRIFSLQILNYWKTSCCLKLTEIAVKW